MDHFEILTVLGAFISMLIGMWKVSRDFRKDMEETIKLLFKRFDDHKQDTDRKLFLLQNSIDEKYMRIDLCNKTSGNIEGRLKSIDIKLDTLLQEKRRHGKTS